MLSIASFPNQWCCPRAPHCTYRVPQFLRLKQGHLQDISLASSFCSLLCFDRDNDDCCRRAEEAQPETRTTHARHCTNIAKDSPYLKALSEVSSTTPLLIQVSQIKSMIRNLQSTPVWPKPLERVLCIGRERNDNLIGVEKIGPVEILVSLWARMPNA